MSDMQDQAAQDSLLKTAASESDSQASSAAQSLSHNSADQSMHPLLRSPCRTSIISSAARSALVRELHVLVDKACEMLQILEEE